MSTVFLRCVNLSISAGWLILAVLLLRFALRKAPRWICCLLWMLVGLRLLCPFTLPSPISLIPSARTIPEDILMSPAPSVSSGIPAIDAQLNPMISATFTPSPETSANPMQIVTFIAACIWLAGVFVMLLYLTGSFIRLHLKMRTATRLRDNIYQSEFAVSPFILGIFRPQIYVNYSLDGDELAHVLAHEQAHLARRDHLLKPLAFLILSIYWFHPLVWLSYLLFCRDIELACDERVIRGMDDARRKAYSLTLLSCAESRTGRRIIHRSAIGACPLAFGVLNIKERVLRIKNYRRPAPFLITAAIVVCAVTAICFLTDPAPRGESQTPAGTNPDRIAAAPSSVSTGNVPDHALGTPSADATPDVPAVPTDVTPGMPAAPTDITPGISTAITSDIIIPGSAGTAQVLITDDEAAAITDAILTHNRSAYTPTSFQSACSFLLLAKAESTPAHGSKRHNISYYGWSYYMEYGITEQGIQAVTSVHVPVQLTFSLDNDYHRLMSMSMPEDVYARYEKPKGYILEEYWEPGGDEKYSEDILANFPSFTHEDALGSQKYLLLQQMDCYRQAILAANLDTDTIDGILEGLLDTIISEPIFPAFHSDLAEDYIGYHPEEYRSLTYYGEYTLDYSKRHPEQDLRGQILLRACNEIQQAFQTVNSTFTGSGASIAQPD